MFSSPQCHFYDHDSELLHTLLTPNNRQEPIIQALNIGHKLYLLPAIAHMEYVSEDFHLLDVSRKFLESLDVNPAKMGQLMIVNAKFW